MSAKTLKDTIFISPVRDMGGSLWEVSLLCGRSHRPHLPQLSLTRYEPYPVRYTYLLSTLLMSAVTGTPFRFGHGGSVATMHLLSSVAITNLTAEAVKKIPGSVGCFEIVWQPNDSKVPF